MLAVAGIKGNQVAVIVTEEHDSTGGGYGTRPGFRRTGHGVLPNALAGFGIDGANEELPKLRGLGARSAA